MRLSIGPWSPIAWRLLHMHILLSFDSVCDEYLLSIYAMLASWQSATMDKNLWAGAE